MSDMQLFYDKTAEEIEAIFDAYTERGFEDLPTELFFSMMGDISHEQPEEYVEIGSTLVGNRLVLHPPTDMPLPFYCAWERNHCGKLPNWLAMAWNAGKNDQVMRERETRKWYSFQQTSPPSCTTKPHPKNTLTYYGNTAG